MNVKKAASIGLLVAFAAPFSAASEPMRCLDTEVSILVSRIDNATEALNVARDRLEGRREAMKEEFAALAERVRAAQADGAQVDLRPLHAKLVEAADAGAAWLETAEPTIRPILNLSRTCRLDPESPLHKEAIDIQAGLEPYADLDEKHARLLERISIVEETAAEQGIEILRYEPKPLRQPETPIPTGEGPASLADQALASRLKGLLHSVK